MKIINSSNDTTTYRFHCKCGCVYEAAEWELQCLDELSFPRFWYTHCPRCGNMISTYEAVIVDSTDTLAETISESESETKSVSTENCCENCAYLGTRDDSSKFCVIIGKELSDTACDLYKSIETYNAERAERTKLREAVNFIQTYCAAHKENCKGCPFNYDGVLECALAQLPARWNTDRLI